MNPAPRKTTALLLLAGLVLGLVGCQQGPENDALKAEVQRKLDEKFEPDLFEVQSLVRNGSYPFQEKGDSTPRLLVYFKARLTFRRDYGLGEADKLNAAVLATLLGATSAGISGIEPEGNKKGDLLKVFGSATYLKKGDGWAPSRRQAPKDEEGAERLLAASANRSQTERWLDELGEEYRRLANKNRREHLRAFEHEAWKARRSIHLRLDRLDGVPSLLTGGQSSEYTAIGRSLARVAKARKIPFHEYRSAGSVQNCRLVGQGLADFGISQNDIAYMAFHGEALFEGVRPYEELRSVCSLYPEALHVVTRKGSGITDVRGLAGKRVAIGPPGSGTRVNAIEVLEAYGLAPSDLAAREESSFENSLDRLAAGELDALFVTMAYPAQPLEKLAADHDIWFLPLEGEPAERLVTEHPFFTKITVPKGTYPDQDEDVRTLGVTALVVTHRDTPDERVRTVLDLLFSSHRVLEAERRRSPIRPLKALERFEESSRVASYISRKTAALGLSIPVHPAAEKVLEMEPKGGGGLPGGN